MRYEENGVMLKPHEKTIEGKLSVFSIENTGYSLVRLTPPTGYFFWYIHTYPPLKKALRTWVKVRNDETKRSVAKGLKRQGYTGSVPWLGAGASYIYECVVAENHVVDVAQFFTLQERIFGNDAYIQTIAHEQVILPNYSPKEIVEDIANSTRRSQFWRLLDSDLGKQIVSIWIGENLPNFLTETDDRNVFFVKILRHLGWPMFVGYMQNLKNDRTVAMPFGETIGLQQLISDYHKDIQRKYPVTLKALGC